MQRRQTRSTPFNPQCFPNRLGDELVDHINISFCSESLVGRLLDPEYDARITYPHIGMFGSVFGLWQWLQNDLNSDVFRIASPSVIKKILLENEDIKTKFVKNFIAIIAHATWLKIKNNRSAIEELKRLPADIHYVSYKKVTEHRMALSYPTWISAIAKEIHTAVRMDREPDFSEFLTHTLEARFCFLEGFLKDSLPSVYKLLNENN